MSHLGQLKKKWDYETNVPRCSTCTHFKQSMIVLTTDSLTKRVNHHCGLGGFTINQNAVCKNWQDKTTGDTLEE